MITKRKLKNPKNGLRGQTWLLVGLSVKPSAMSLWVKKRVLTGRFLLCLRRFLLFLASNALFLSMILLISAPSSAVLVLLSVGVSSQPPAKREHFIGPSSSPVSSLEGEELVETRSGH